MRPLNLGETLDGAMAIVRTRWRVLAPIMLVVVLPVRILDVVILGATTVVYDAGSGLAGPGGATVYDDRGLYLAGQVAIGLLEWLVYLVGFVACYRAIVDTRVGRPTSADASLRFAADRLGATLGLSALVLLGCACGLLALVIPGIWVAVAWSVALPVLVVEGVGGRRALRRSAALVRGRWWETAGRLLVASIMVVVGGGLVSAVLLSVGLSVLSDTSAAALVLQQLVDGLVTLITAPFLAAVILLVYFDLRARRESFDPTTLAGGPPAAVPPPHPPADAGWSPPAARRPGEPDSPPPGRWAPPQAPRPTD